MIPDSKGNSAPSSSLDPNMLFASMMNGGGTGFGNGNWMWVLFLFFLYPLMRNGFWGNNGSSDGLGSLGNLVNNDAGRELLMQAINRNGDAIGNLANMFNTSTDIIQQALCGINNSITKLSGQVGMSGQQVINAIQQGNMGIASQLAECCCNIRTAVTQSNYENQIATLQQTQVLNTGLRDVTSAVTRGFCDTAYSFRDQTCQLGSAIQGSTQTIKDTTNQQTTAIIAKLDSMERNAMQSKIDGLTEANSTLRTQLNLEHQNAITAQAIASAVNPINAQLAEIKNSQPNTVTVPYYPFNIVPSCNCGANTYGTSCGTNCANKFWY
uniref:Spike protein/glycoprotein n=1 Tax=Geladintestivirus 2 TaxID=3233134 RepID=A0AAU8MM20_9CAUD